DVDAKTHPYISTGLKENKFGVPIDDAPALYAEGARHPGLEMMGVTCHIGSQITSMGPFIDAAERMARLATALAAAGAPLTHIGMGGGLGVPYHHETPPDPAVYGAALARVLKPLGLRVILEPGRVLVGNAGVLLTRVVRRKRGADRDFVILDAGMNDLMRPALYDAYHAIEPVTALAGAEAAVDVVGPVCESADTFARARPLGPVAAGDLIALRTAGAYGFVMACTYNGRPRPAEVLCDGEQALLIRSRETVADLWRGERRLDGSPVDETLPGC
ncbi:MAG TPA: diaminopimelate decarboxylase, partial [Myxococcota bacterium]|nr:diaminopimelate decarboxylase [Myxococcota bacterium]